MLLTQTINLPGTSVSVPPALARSARVLLALIALGGATVHAASYRLVDAAAPLAPLAVGVGIAALTAWIGFGFLVLTAAEMRPRRYRGITVLHWADACLVALAAGVAVKMVGVAVNILIAGVGGGRADLALIAPIQLVILVATDVTIGVVFARFAGRLGMPMRTAATLWIVGFNGILVAVLGALAYGGVI
jgi:hypothetical protein